MKKLFNFMCLCLVSVLLLGVSLPVSAANSNDATADEDKIYLNDLSITTVQIDGQNVQIPIYEENATPLLAASDLVSDIQKEVTYFIPVTDTAKNYNDNLIKTMQSRISGSNQAIDARGYVTVTSTINFTRDYYNGHPRIKMSSFRLTKNRNLDSYLIGIRRPTATVYQLGYYGPAGHPEVMDQSMYTGFEWSSTVSVPSSWLPVCTDVGSHLRGIQYNLSFLYNDQQFSSCNFFHYCN